MNGKENNGGSKRGKEVNLGEWSRRNVWPNKYAYMNLNF